MLQYIKNYFKRKHVADQKESVSFSQRRRAKWYPECLWSLRVDEQKVTVTDHLDETTVVNWSHLIRVVILTNDQGPWKCDFFWCLYTTDKEPLCSIPNVVSGIEELVEFLIKMPSFDHRMLIKANCSVDNAQFLCWEKQHT